MLNGSMDPVYPVGGNTRSPTLTPVTRDNNLEDSPNSKRIAPSKRWCFTIFKFKDDWKETFGSVFQPKSKFCVGVEICPKTSNTHLQGYIEFHDKVRPLNMMRNYFPGIHLEKCKGSREQNLKYCQKDGDYIVHGFEDIVRYDPGFKGIIEYWNSSHKIEEIYTDPAVHSFKLFEVIIWRAWTQSCRFTPPSSVNVFRNNIELAYQVISRSSFPPSGYTSEDRATLNRLLE